MPTEAGGQVKQNEPMIGMLMSIHAAVRRDLDRFEQSLQALLGASADERRSGAQSVLAYWDRFSAMLEHHHVVEDDEVWPHLEQVHGEPARQVFAEMVSEHGEVVASEPAVAGALTALTAHADAAALAAAVAQVRTYREIIERHLSHEEQDAVPFIASDEDAGFWVEFQERRQRDEGPDVFLPWVLDQAPPVVVETLQGELPPPVRALLVEQWIPVHDGLVRALP